LLLNLLIIAFKMFFEICVNRQVQIFLW